MKSNTRYLGWIKWLRKFFYCLFLVRFNLILLVAGWLLLQVDQGQDALVSYAARNDWLKAGFWFFFWVFYWAFSIWFFARTMFRFHFPTTPIRKSDEIPDSEKVRDTIEITTDDSLFLWMKEYLPRVLGTLAFLAVAHALWSARKVVETDLTGRFLLWLVISLVLIIPFFIIVKKRRDMANAIGKSLKKRNLAIANTSFGKSLQETDIENEPAHKNLLQLIKSPWGWFVLVALGIHLVAFVFSTINPVATGTFMSAILLFFLWAGSWLPIGSLITYIGNMYGVPMISFFLIAALVFSASNDNHEIRTLGDLPERKNIDQALENWRISQENSDNKRLVLVTTAGGGIRAAYWTATVLGELHGRVDGFDNRLFAISGVSGGSVGASVYRAVLSEGVPATEVKAKSQAVLSGDFLGPAVAGLLYPDLAQRFFPNLGLPDRGVALEKGWENAYKIVMKSDTFSESLLSLYDDSRQWPALLLNATRVESGRRCVASNLKMESKERPENFSVLDDQFQDIGHDLSLSAAAHNSARFPGVSPAGHWKDDKGNINGRLVDGGYFENFGAEAVLGLMRTIDWKSKKWMEFKPVIIAISSDPNIKEPFSKTPTRKVSKFAHEILSPVKALLSARTSHGIEALQRLKQETEALGGHFFHLRMCAPEEKGDDDRKFNPPLGWSLSKVAMETIKGYLGAKCNGDKLTKLVQELASAPAR